MPGASGTWKDLTGNVNLLAENLTNQVRAIADVATAVTKGDLTRSVQVEARGEVAELKDNINTMIDNLRLTTERNTEQDWLKTNLAHFTGMLQGQRDLAHRRQEAAVGAGAAGRTPTRASSTAWTTATCRICACSRATPTTTSRAIPHGCRSAPASSASAPSTSAASCISDIPPIPCASARPLMDALPKSLVIFPVMFENRDQGGHRAGLAARVRAARTSCSSSS